MKAEATLQYMADFYPDLFPTRKHALDHLFCTIGNGYDWVNGELVDNDDEYSKRYKLVQDIIKAEFSREVNFWGYHALFEEIAKATGKPNTKYPFHWYPLSRKYSYLFNYPKNIKSDWKALLEECRELLIADGVDLDNVD